MAADANTKADKFLELLEQWLMQRGDLVISSTTNVQPVLDDVAASSWGCRNPAAPPSLVIYPDVILLGSLKDQAEEMEGRKRLEDALGKLMRDGDTLTAANAKLDTQAQGLRGLENESLPQKLVSLRTEQQRAREPKLRTFAVSAVTMTDPRNGDIAEVMEYHLPATTSWESVQQALMDMTISEQAREAGFQSGYGLKDGKWTYQITKNHGIPDKAHHDLTSREEYKRLRRVLIEDGMSVLVWHEILWRKSERLREEFDGLCDAERKASDQEPSDDNITTQLGQPLDPHVDLVGDVALYMEDVNEEAMGHGSGGFEEAWQEADTAEPQTGRQIRIDSKDACNNLDGLDGKTHGA